MSKSCVARLHFSCPLRAGFCLGFVPTGVSARVLIILARIGGVCLLDLPGSGS